MMAKKTILWLLLALLVASVPVAGLAEITVDTWRERFDEAWPYDQKFTYAPGVTLEEDASISLVDSWLESWLSVDISVDKKDGTHEMFLFVDFGSLSGEDSGINGEMLNSAVALSIALLTPESERGNVMSIFNKYVELLSAVVAEGKDSSQSAFYSDHFIWVDYTEEDNYLAIYISSFEPDDPIQPVMASVFQTDGAPTGAAPTAGPTKKPSTMTGPMAPK